MKSFLSALLIVLINSYAPAQELIKTTASKLDTTKSVADSLSAESDSLKENSTGIDTVIYASSKDSLIFFVNQKKMDLYGSGEIKYQATDLKSENIHVNFIFKFTDGGKVFDI